MQWNRNCVTAYAADNFIYFFFTIQNFTELQAHKSLSTAAFRPKATLSFYLELWYNFKDSLFLEASRTHMLGLLQHQWTSSLTYLHLGKTKHSWEKGKLENFFPDNGHCNLAWLMVFNRNYHYYLKLCKPAKYLTLRGSTEFR